MRALDTRHARFFTFLHFSCIFLRLFSPLILSPPFAALLHDFFHVAHSFTTCGKFSSPDKPPVPPAGVLRPAPVPPEPTPHTAFDFLRERSNLFTLWNLKDASVHLFRAYQRPNKRIGSHFSSRHANRHANGHALSCSSTNMVVSSFLASRAFPAECKTAASWTASYPPPRSVDLPAGMRNV
jgi:hypothetical protein